MKILRYILVVLIVIAVFASLTLFVRKHIMYSGCNIPLTAEAMTPRSSDSVWVNVNKPELTEDPNRSTSVFVRPDESLSVLLDNNMLLIKENGKRLPIQNFSLEMFRSNSGKPIWRLRITSLDSSSPLSNGKTYTLAWPWLVRLRWLLIPYLIILFYLLFPEIELIWSWLIRYMCNFLKSKAHFILVLIKLLFIKRDPSLMLDKKVNMLYRHALCFGLAISTGILCFGMTVQPAGDTWDPMRYQAEARYFLERGIFIPRSITYKRFSINPEVEISHYEERDTWGYPNKGFSLMLALVSWFSGSYNQTNAQILNLFAMMSLAGILYCLGYFLTNSRIMGLLLCIVMSTQSTVTLPYLKERPDLGFFAIFSLSLLAVFKNRCLATGLLLGIGYWYREQAIMFCPLLPLFAPQSVTFRATARSVFFSFIGFIPGFVLYKFFESLYTIGHTHVSGYLGIFKSSYILNKFFDFGNLALLTKYLDATLLSLGPVLVLILCVLLLRFFRLERMHQRMLAVGVATYLAAVVVLYPFPNLELRTGLYLILILWVLMLISLRQFRYGTLFFTVFVLVNMFTSPMAVNLEGVRLLKNPVKLWKYMNSDEEYLNGKFALTAPNSVILSRRESVPARRYFSKPYVISQDFFTSFPTYEQFLSGPQNDKIDAIIYFDRWKDDWPGVQDGVADIIDRKGIRFKRVELPDARYPIDYFVRADVLVADEVIN